MAAVCEVEVNSGQCGVQAVGRCVFCGKAFCDSHRARSSNGMTYFTDACAPCYPKTSQGQAEQRYREALDVQLYVQDKARAALLASGAQTVNVFQITKRSRYVETRKGIFGRTEVREEYASETIELGRGWLLGELTWKYKIHGDSLERSEPWLTALVEIARDAVPGDYRSNWPLVRVRPCQGGYRLVSDYDTFQSWISAKEAVERLIRPSS